MHLRDRSLMSAALPAPAPLPSLQTAFSRRAAIFGFVSAGTALMAGNVALAARIAAPPTLDPADARLADLAEQMIQAQAACDAHQGSDDEFSVVVDHLDNLSIEMDRAPAATFSGVLQKLRVIHLPSVGNDGNAHDIMVSICEDIARLHAEGSLR